jgi:histidyl-tRNA synthetase
VCVAVCSGISAELDYQLNPKPRKTLEKALRTGSRFMVTIGETELAAGTVTVKDIRASTQVAVPRDCMVAHLRSALHPVADCGSC